jgi:hypothetical protein
VDPLEMVSIHAAHVTLCMPTNVSSEKWVGGNLPRKQLMETMGESSSNASNETEIIEVLMKSKN